MEALFEEDVLGNALLCDSHVQTLDFLLLPQVVNEDIAMNTVPQFFYSTRMEVFMCSVHCLSDETFALFLVFGCDFKIAGVGSIYVERFCCINVTVFTHHNASRCSQ